MTPLTQALNTALLHFIWQGIAIGLLLWIALFLLRRGSASARYVVSCSALALLVLAPMVTAWSAYTPQAQAGVSWKISASTVASQDLGRSANPLVGIAPGYQRLQAWILPAWVLGVALFSLRLMWCWVHTSVLRRKGIPADDTFLAMVSRAAERIGVTRSIRVLMSSVAEVPSVIGWVRPVLLLPVAVAAGLTPEQLEAVIAHELAHIRRHDYLVNLVQAVAETVLFYHPMVWWVSSKIRYERELCCDDLAVAAVGDAASYARALARLEQVRVFRPSLAMGAAGGPLFHRIERLLGGDGSREGPSRLACAVGLLIGTACFALNMGWAEGLQGIRSSNKGDMVEDFFTVLPPVSSVPTLPPMPPIKAMPLMYAKVSPKLFAAYESLAQRGDVPWVLFRGDRVISRGSSADEADARAARQSSGGGDVLWFRLEGKAYLAQDTAILDRFADFRTNSTVLADMQEFLAQQQQKASMHALDLQIQQQRLQVDLKNKLAAIQAQMPNTDKLNSFEQLNSLRVELDQVRRSLDEMAAKLNQQELGQLQSNIAVQREAELRARLKESDRFVLPQIPDVLRDAVSEGKARPVQ